MQTYQLRVTVAPEHLDDLNHVNNVQYLEWVQQVSKEHWQKLSRPEWDANYIWVVRSHHITYQRSALLGEELEIRTFVKEARGAQSERHVLITQGDRETPVVSCKTIWVLLDARSGKPVRLPDSMLKVFE